MTRTELLEELAALVAEVLPTLHAENAPCPACGAEQESAGFLLRAADAEALRTIVYDLERSKREAA